MTRDETLSDPIVITSFADIVDLELDSPALQGVMVMAGDSLRPAQDRDSQLLLAFCGTNTDLLALSPEDFNQRRSVDGFKNIPIGDFCPGKVNISFVQRRGALDAPRVFVASQLQFFTAYPSHLQHGTCVITGEIITFTIQDGKITFRCRNKGVCL